MNAQPTMVVDPMSALQQPFSAALLNPVVSKVLQASVQVNHWTTRPLTDYTHEVRLGGAGVSRIGGTATTAAGVQRAWSVILKVLKSPAGMPLPDGTTVTQAMADDRQAFAYWRREAAAYESGLLAGLPRWLVAPACYGIDEKEDELWLWQAEAVDTAAWSWTHYREAAYRLGQWQGQYATGERALPAFGWLSRKWLRQWVSLPLTRIVELLDRTDGWRMPVVEAHFTAKEIAAVRRLWARRAQPLAHLARLPQVLCHLDAYRANFFWQGDTLTLIDWEFAGLGALGEEMAAFVGGTLLLDHVPLDEAPYLEAVALDGYLAGLREAGWVGEADLVWQAYGCAIPLRYALLALATVCRTALQPEFGQHWLQRTGKPLDEILSQRADFVRFLLARCQST
jgi:hypothetical protein